MHHRWKWLFAFAAVLLALAGSLPASAGVPDVTKSFFVPQAGGLTTPCEGATGNCPGVPANGNLGLYPIHIGGGAVGCAVTCPNIDGPQVLVNWARLKVVVLASDNSPIANIPAADICALFNGGTTIQGFSGLGADSVQADPAVGGVTCPPVRCITADAPTDANGVTYITWIGHRATDPPGMGNRDTSRKWGGYDSDIPIMVLGYKLQGRLTTASAIGTYKAVVHNVDVTPYIGTASERVTAPADYNVINSALTGVYNYKVDFDGNGTNSTGDFNQINGGHLNHNCSTPNP